MPAPIALPGDLEREKEKREVHEATIESHYRRLVASIEEERA